MKPETETKMYLGVGSFVLGAIVTMIIGFAWGGWSTSGTTKTMTDEAVLASQAAICVAQFMKEPNHEENLKEFEKISSWERDDFVKKGGWDKMPGQKDADYAVTQACTEGIEFLIGK